MKTFTRILVLLTAIVVFNSCRKDRAHERYTENNLPQKPDLSVKVTTSVAGFVMDENDNPVGRVQVVAGTKEVLTDEFGYFSISDVSLPKTAGFVKVEKTGYFTGYRTFLPQEDKESFVLIKLLPKTNFGNIDAVSGGTVNTPEGARVTLPSNGVVVASGGAAYTGTVNVAMRWIDASDRETVRLSAPGDSRGIDNEDHLKLLNSYSSIAVELTDNSGQLLQIAPGKQATISIPVPSSLSGSAPATIDLWSFDESNGLWKQESTAVKNGNSYTGNVSHFSFWDGATGVPLVQISARIVDASLQPLVNVAVVITIAGQPDNSGFGKFARTDANGFVFGSVMANTNFVLKVITPCATDAYSHNFNTANSDIDLGTFTGNMGQGLVTITGTALDCNNLPVTNGYVQTYDNGFYNRVPIVNGAFSFTGLACTNTETTFVVIDNNAYQQSTPQTINLITGANDLGVIAACGTSTIGTISFTIDGVTRNLVEPADTLAAFFISPQGIWTAVLKLSPNTNPDINFQFDGGAAVGNGHKVTEIFSKEFPGGRAIAPVPLTVTITEYGSVGGFISGSFSGLVLDFPNNGVHNMSCNFRIRRYN